jgi:mono/diheme cytochrome c family protein
MKPRSILFTVALFLLGIFGCQTSSYGPAPVTAELIRAGAARHADEGTLREGRRLFVSRCIECHSLPVVSDYRASAWPHLVDKMADRADLKSSERNAVVAYILAARAQTK